MPARRRQAASSLASQLERQGLDFVRCQFIDLIGIARNRLVPRSQMSKTAARGLAFGAFGTTLDVDDIPSDPLLGSHSGDFWAVPDPASLIPLPWLQATGHMFCDLVAGDGTPWPSCARTALSSLVETATRQLGQPDMAFESEGYLL